MMTEICGWSQVNKKIIGIIKTIVKFWLYDGFLERVNINIYKSA